MSIKSMIKHNVLCNSPIPFVILGPKGQKNVFILRSSNVTLDLLGYAVIKRKRSSGLCSFSGSIFNIKKSHNFIRSKPVDIVKTNRDDHDDSDMRLSEYLFCWSGNCNFQDGEKIADMFELQISDILDAIENYDIDQAELHVSSIIYLCSLANKTFSIKRKWSIFTSIIYVICLAVVSYFIISNIYRMSIVTVISFVAAILFIFSLRRL